MTTPCTLGISPASPPRVSIGQRLCVCISFGNHIDSSSACPQGSPSNQIRKIYSMTKCITKNLNPAFCFSCCRRTKKRVLWAGKRNVKRQNVYTWHAPESNAALNKASNRHQVYQYEHKSCETKKKATVKVCLRVHLGGKFHSFRMSSKR